MKYALLKLYVRFQTLCVSEDGQDLVEYALLLTIISLALISSMNGIASSLRTVFSNISSSLS
jgi:pilus assembly protein Flp/PilA